MGIKGDGKAVKRLLQSCSCSRFKEISRKCKCRQASSRTQADDVLSVLSQRTSNLLYGQDVSPVIVKILFCDSRITIEPVSSHNCSSDAQFFHMKHLRVDNCFTWYGDDRYILIGHHAGGAALLHIEVRRLEKSPVETQRSRNVTRKFVTESLSHCSQIQSVDISLCHLNSNGMGVGRNLIMKTPQSMRTHTQGAENTLLGDPPRTYPSHTRCKNPPSATSHTRHCCTSTVKGAEYHVCLVEKRKHRESLTLTQPSSHLPGVTLRAEHLLNVSPRLNDVETLHLKKGAANDCNRLRLLTLLPWMQAGGGT